MAFRTELRGKSSGSCLFVLVQLVDALHLKVVAGLDFVQLFPLLFQLPLELILLHLHGPSLRSRPADPAFQLHNPSLQGHRSMRTMWSCPQTRPPRSLSKTIPQPPAGPKCAHGVPTHTWRVPRARSSRWVVQMLPQAILEDFHFSRHLCVYCVSPWKHHHTPHRNSARLAWGRYRHTSFYWASQVLYFLEIESRRQSCMEQVRQHHFFQQHLLTPYLCITFW